MFITGLLVGASVLGLVAAELQCPTKFGYFPDPSDCQGYFICTFGTAKQRKCGGALIYQHTKQICDVSKAECTLEDGQARRPTYSGLQMKNSGDSPAPFQASAPQPIQEPPTHPPPPPPPTTPVPQMAPPISASDSRSLDQQQNQRPRPSSGAVTKRPYDFFREPPTTQYPSEQSRIVTKQAEPETTSAKFKNNRPTFRPVGGRAPAPTTTAAPIQMADPNNRPPARLPEKPLPPLPMNQQQPNRAPLPNKALPQNVAPIPPSQQDWGAPPAQVSEQNQPNGFQQAPRNEWQEGNGAPWQTPQNNAPPRFPGDWQQQQQQAPSVPNQFADWNPKAVDAERPPPAQGFENDDQRFQQSAIPQQRPLREFPSQPDAGNLMNSAAQNLPQVPYQNAPGDKRLQESAPYQKAPAAQPSVPEMKPPRRQPIIPTDSAFSQCVAEKCRLPNCYCGGTAIPGGLPVQETPQMVIISFDAEINERNLPIYEQIFNKNRKNPNGCNIKATFFVSHEFTNYGMVRYLYEKGHEIASHSITHGVGNGFRNEVAWSTEMSGQKGFLASFASIRPEDIKGSRAPLLGVGGDDQFNALYKGDFQYDSSIATPVSSKAPFWPYTLDFAVPHACVTPPCPKRGYPGFWEIPLNPIYGLFGETCYQADRCTFGSTGSDVYKLLYGLFYDKHYNLNKAPFQLAIHADWLKYPPHREAFEKFLDTIGSMNDVWVVTGSQAISWMKRPTPLSNINELPAWQCSADDASRLPQCDTINACPLEFRNRLRYFYTCSACPAEFPWIPEF